MSWKKLAHKQPVPGDFVLILSYYVDENIEIKDKVEYAWYGTSNGFTTRTGAPSGIVHYWLDLPPLPNAPKSIFDMSQS